MRVSRSAKPIRPCSQTGIIHVRHVIREHPCGSPKIWNGKNQFIALHRKALQPLLDFILGDVLQYLLGDDGLHFFRSAFPFMKIDNRAWVDIKCVGFLSFIA